MNLRMYPKFVGSLNMTSQPITYQHIWFVEPWNCPYSGVPISVTTELPLPPPPPPPPPPPTPPPPQRDTSRRWPFPPPPPGNYNVKIVQKELYLAADSRSLYLSPAAVEGKIVVCQRFTSRLLTL